MISNTLLSPGVLRPHAVRLMRRWYGGLSEQFDLERDRWLSWIPVLLGVGVAGYFLLQREPSLSSGLILFAAATAFAFGLRRWPVLARIAVALAIIAGGFLAAELRSAIVAAPVLDKPIGPALISGRVTEVELQEKTARVVL